MPFDPTTSVVDHVQLADLRTPGVAEVVHAGSPREWDERRGAYLSGATLRFKGIRVAEFTIVVKLWETDHFEAWDALVQRLARPPAFERPQSLEIVHPITAQLGIAAVVVTDISQLTQTDDGLWVAEIRVKEYRALTRASSEAIVGAATEEPTDPVERAIAVRVARIDQLNARAGS